jgi:hypothetical protein
MGTQAQAPWLCPPACEDRSMAGAWTKEPCSRRGTGDVHDSSASRECSVQAACSLHLQTMESSACATGDEESALQAAAHVSPSLQAWCTRLGMRPEAPHGWARMHVNPMLIMCVSFGTDWCSWLICILMIVDAKFKLPQVTIPIIVHLVSELLLSAGFWRNGPDFWGTPAFLVCLTTAMIAACTSTFAGFTTPESSLHELPFGSLPWYTTGSACVTWCLSMANNTGRTKAEWPVEPHRSLLVPLVKSTVTTLRAMDSLADMSMIRTLLAEVRSVR